MTAAIARQARPARQEVRLPFGRTAEGRMVSVEAVERGVACECFCPKCSASLVAAKGETYRHHFRHYVDYGGAYCAEARETALHLFAKQVICDQLQLELPDYGLMDLRHATAECRLGEIVPDVLAELDSGETVAIEIWVAHQVPEHKVKAYNDRRQAAVEIDLRPYRLTDKVEADWENVVLHEAERTWLSPPNDIRRARETERQRWLKARRKLMLAERAWMRQVERKRIAAELALRTMAADRAAHMMVKAAVRRELEQREIAEHYRQQLELAEQRAKDAEVRRVMVARLEREMRSPDLQEMVRAHGGYDRITPEAWAVFDRELREWRLRTAVGDFHRRPYRHLARAAGLTTEQAIELKQQGW